MGEQAIKDFYTHKKIDFAKKLSYIEGSPPWGNYFGFDLAKPYTELEVQDIEAILGFDLPLDLSFYLLRVSRELFTEAYPIIFGEHCYPSDNIGMCTACASESYINYSERKMDNQGFMTIGESGCDFSTQICVRAVHDKVLGTIWRDVAGESKTKIANSLYEFLRKQICK